MSEFVGKIPVDSHLNKLAERDPRMLARRIVECGDYVPVRNPGDREKGRWRICGARQTIFARANLAPKERVEAVKKYIKKTKSTRSEATGAADGLIPMRPASCTAPARAGAFRWFWPPRPPSYRIFPKCFFSSF